MSTGLADRRRDGEESWISVSDLMAGLMMVFLFLAVIYARDADQRTQNVTEIVTEWRDTELKIYRALFDEFEDDLPRWNAEIDKESLTIRFLSPTVLFAANSAEIKPRFRDILNDFVPRYIALLHDRFAEDIREVRIEGHTSSEWFDSTDATEAFIKNMELSQARTRAVLDFSMKIPAVLDRTSWMRRTVSSNGLSSARLVMGPDGIEDKHRSRRVEFTIRTRTKEILFRIIDRIEPAAEAQAR